jgi:uncharacterized protein (TIGR03067 family)
MNTVLLGLAVAVGAPALKDKDKAPAIVGEWVVESVANNGAPAGVGGGLRYTFTADGEWLIHREGKELPLVGATRGYTVDPKPNPPAVDLVTSRAAGGESRLLGIFKVEGDTLTICGTRAKGGDRPTKFDAPEGSNLTVYVLKRVKKDKE